jgi:hypothetical protein
VKLNGSSVLPAWTGVVLGFAAILGYEPAGRAQSSVLSDLPVTAKSRSGQFIVHGRSSELQAPTTDVRRVGTNETVSLQPDLLAVTAERIKRRLELQLGADDRWSSVVHLQLRDARQITGPLVINTSVLRDGWRYQIVLPDRIGWERLVRTLSEAVLLERANRANDGMECALPPLWLTEGLTQLLLTDDGRDLVTESATFINRSQLRTDPLDPIRSALRGREPMSFSELSLATPEQLGDPAEFTFFRANAALFVHELLRLENGKAAVREFLHQLPASLNWQTTFLRVNSGRFDNLLAIEKWWAVAAAEALATDSRQQWPRERVLARLAELLVETADVRTDTNSPATRQSVPISQVVTAWEYPLQRDVLRRKASQLRALAMRSPPDLAPLVADYSRTLADYVATRDRGGAQSTGRTQIEVRGPMVAESTAKRLAGLDRRRQAEEQRPAPFVPRPAVYPRTTNAPPSAAIRAASASVASVGR